MHETSEGFISHGEICKNTKGRQNDVPTSIFLFRYRVCRAYSPEAGSDICYFTLNLEYLNWTLGIYLCYVCFVMPCLLFQRITSPPQPIRSNTITDNGSIWNLHFLEFFFTVRVGVFSSNHLPGVSISAGSANKTSCHRLCSLWAGFR